MESTCAVGEWSKPRVAALLGDHIQGCEIGIFNSRYHDFGIIWSSLDLKKLHLADFLI